MSTPFFENPFVQRVVWTLLSFGVAAGAAKLGLGNDLIVGAIAGGGASAAWLPGPGRVDRSSLPPAVQHELKRRKQQYKKN